jgi:putative autoinducer-2 (AI-2) aldolase
VVSEAHDYGLPVLAITAVGVDMGRNIWQSDYPEAMFRAINGIVHNGLSAKEALELYLHLTQSKVF